MPAWYILMLIVPSRLSQYTYRSHNAPTHDLITHNLLHVFPRSILYLITAKPSTFPASSNQPSRYPRATHDPYSHTDPPKQASTHAISTRPTNPPLPETHLVQDLINRRFFRGGDGHASRADVLERSSGATRSGDGNDLHQKASGGTQV